MGATEILLGPDEVRVFLKPEYAATPAQSGATAAPQREQ